MSPSPEDFFRALEGRRTQALVQGDMPLLQALHSPDYQLITPNGSTFTRERYLESIASGRLRYVQWTMGNIAVRASERMALLRYQATLCLAGEDGVAGTPFVVWHTDSYELTSGGWQAVWSQATSLRRTTP